MKLDSFLIAQDILQNMNIGTWASELYSDGSQSLYCDDKMLELIGATTDLSPLEMYQFLFEHTDEESFPRLQAYTDKMLRGEYSEVIYRYRHPLLGLRLVRCNGHMVKEEGGIKYFQGIHSDITEVDLIKGTGTMNTLAHTQASSTLTHDLECLTWIDLTNNHYIRIHSSNNFISLFNKRYTNDFFDNFKNDICNVSSIDDIKAIKAFFNKEYIISKLEESNEPALLEYRVGDKDNYYYYRCKMSYVPGDKTHLIGAIENVTEEVKSRNKHEEENFNLKNVLSMFLGLYQSILLVKPDTNEYEILEESSDFSIRNNYSTEFTNIASYYCNNFIYPPDQAKFLPILNIEKMISILKDKNEFMIRFRDIGFTQPTWIELKAIKISKDSNNFFLGLMDITKSYIDNSISKNLYQSFSSIFVIDLFSEQVSTITDNPPYTYKGFKRGALKDFFLNLSKNIEGEVKDICIELSSKERFISRFQKKKKEEIVYPIGDGSVFKRASISILDGDKENFTLALLTYQVLDNDEALKLKLSLDLEKQKDVIQNNYRIINGLSQEYFSLFLVDSNKGRYISFYNDKKPKFLTQFSNEKKYSDLISHFITSRTHKSYHQKLASDLRLENVKFLLKDKISYRIVYQNKQSEYCIIELIKVESKENDFDFVIGFSNKDKEIRTRQENEDVIKTLSNEYLLVFVADVKSEELKVYRMNYRFYNLIPDFDQDSSYTTTLNKIANSEVFVKNKKYFLKTLSLDNIVKELKINETFTFNFTLSKSEVESKWQANYMYASLAKDKVVIAIRNIDNEIAKEIERSNILRRNLNMISVLANEYSSVYYFDVTGEELYSYNENNNEDKLYEDIFKTNNTYTKYINYFISHYIIPNEIDRAYKQLDINTIVEQLKHKDMYNVILRTSLGGMIRYSEFKFYRADKNEIPSSIVFAFTEKDERIFKDYVYNRLVDDLEGIYFIDLAVNRYRTALSSKFTPIHLPKEGPINSLVDEFFALDMVDKPAVFDGILDEDRFFSLFKDGDEKKEFIYSIKGKDNVIHWRRVSLSILEKVDGKPISLIITFNELDTSSAEKEELNKKISEQANRLEIQQIHLLEALEDAKKANEVKSTFLFNMSHDIRTPMNAIIGLLDLTLKDTKNTHRVENYLTKAQKSSKYLLSIINDVLDMTRIDNNKMTLNMNSAYLGELLSSLYLYIAPLANARNIDVSFKVHNIEHEHIVTDETRLQQIFMNLISNAIKFTPKGGPVYVDISEEDVIDNIVHYTFVVKDTGIGMSKEFLSRIFQPFEREVTPTVSKTSGSGLGMSICKSLVDMMGGMIKVESIKGEGSTFIVDIPFFIADTSDTFEYKDKSAVLFNLSIKQSSQLEPILAKVGIDCINLTNSESELINEKHNILFVAIDKNSEINSLDINNILAKMDESTRVILITPYDWFYVIDNHSSEINVDGYLSGPIFESQVLSTLNDLFTKKKTSLDETKLFEDKVILLVEDNTLNREIANEILNDIGFKVITARDGEEALNIVKESKSGDIDLILMDIQMPIMNGYEASKAIRALPNSTLAALPIIALTANAFDEDQKNSFEAGMNAHIAKPINVHILIDTLKKILH